MRRAETISHRTARTPEGAREAFLEALGRGASIAGACREAGIGRTTAYDIKASDEAFAQAWDDALEAGTDRLEDEAWRRAHDGVEEPLVSGGRQVLGADGVPLVGRRYSDNLLVTLLKARRPERFKDRVASEVKADVSIGDGVSGLAAYYAALDDIASRKSRGEPTPELDLLPAK